MCRTFDFNGADLTIICGSASPEVDKRNCWTFDGSEYKQVGDFNIDHYEGGINTWGDSVIAFGKDYNGTTEIYNPAGENWSIMIDDSIIKGLLAKIKINFIF